MLRVLPLLLALAAAGCGYTTGSTLDDKYRTIYVEPFRNDTREYGLQAPLTTAVTRTFVNDTRLRVTGPEAADLIVSGAMRDYRLRALSYDEEDEPTQFHVAIVARIQVRDRRTGEILWQDEAITGENTFGSALTGARSDRLRGNTQAFVPLVTSFQTTAENRAASEALMNLANDIFYRTVEPW
jgi:hypothetical protein